MLIMSASVTLEGYAEFQTWSILEDGSSADPIGIDLVFNYDRAEGESYTMKRQQLYNEETTNNAEHFHYTDNFVSRANGLCRF